MAIGVATDLNVYNDFFQAGFFEGTQQSGDKFNENSGGTINMVSLWPTSLLIRIIILIASGFAFLFRDWIGLP